jgi:hypothetical protein
MITLLRSLYLIIFFLVLGCGHQISYVDPELKPYVESFEKEALRFGLEIHVSGLVITMGEHDKMLELTGGKTYAGFCMNYDTIYIDPLYWPRYSADQKESLMFHELAHCVLHREHDTVQIYDGRGILIPRSLMYPQIPPPGVESRYRDYYLGELFSSASL